MELTNEFDVAVPIERAWAVLTDVERIAPCLPGAELQEVEGDEYRGVVKIKVGPITTSYQGVARFVEVDEATHRASLRAEARESRGQGNASATITATMSSIDAGTRVSVVTDLSITGKVAQFGRGVLSDVSAKLLDQFVANLESTVLAGDADDGTTTTSAERVRSPEHESEGVRHVDAAPAAPVDLLDAAGSSVARRVLRPLMIAGAATLVAARVLRRRRR